MTRGERNAELLALDTLYDRTLKAYRGVLKIEKDAFRWWVCSHAHEHVTDAYDCAHAAREQVRSGILTHNLTGSP